MRRLGLRCRAAAIALLVAGLLPGTLSAQSSQSASMIGKVVDFLLFHYAEWAYPAFNVADSAITVGAAFLILDSFRRPRRDSKEAPRGV